MNIQVKRKGDTFAKEHSRCRRKSFQGDIWQDAFPDAPKNTLLDEESFLDNWQGRSSSKSEATWCSFREKRLRRIEVIYNINITCHIEIICLTINYRVHKNYLTLIGIVISFYTVLTASYYYLIYSNTLKRDHKNWTILILFDNIFTQMINYRA